MHARWPPSAASRHPYTVMWSREKKRSRVLKGLASGAVGGLVASWTMNQFQKGWNKAARAIEQNRHPQGEKQERQSQGESEDATMLTAERISEGVLHRQLSKERRKKLGPVVHYSFGTLTGALYGAVSELLPRARTGEGVLFGTAVFAGADELSLWAFGLAGPPTQYPLSTHAQAWASHCVYGLATETVRKTILHFW